MFKSNILLSFLRQNFKIITIDIVYNIYIYFSVFYIMKMYYSTFKFLIIVKILNHNIDLFLDMVQERFQEKALNYV